MNCYRLSIKEVFDLFGSGENGLAPAEAEARLIRYGPNQLQEKKDRSIARILLAQFKDLMILILLAAAIISGISGDLTDTIFILVIVLLNALLGFYQEFKAQKAIGALKQMAVPNVQVLRNGHVHWLPANFLVPGDLVLLEAGNAIPADLRIVESSNLKVDEAALTGESLAVDKITRKIDIANLPVADQNNMAFKGSFVTYGRGSAIVTGTGMDTELGRIAKMLEEEETLTPLQKRMTSFGKKLSVIVLLLCIVFFVAGWLRGEDILTMILTSISLAVAAIPEALPAVITISLALAAKRMVRLKSLVRNLPAMETLGSVTCICTDKTGTLTGNKMYTEQVYVNGMLYRRDELPAVEKNKDVLLLLQAFALNNDARSDGDAIKGDSTEIALMELARELQINPDWPRLDEIAFDPDRKLMTTFHPYGKGVIAFTKGAPDILLKRCVNLDEQELQLQVDRMAVTGQRVLGFACRYWDSLPVSPESSVHETGLQFLGLAGIIDPPRTEVPGAIAQCKMAGIIPILITGDHPLTAKAIAQRTGIISSEEDLTLTGRQLQAMDEKTLLDKIERIKVYARVSPEQKLRIVKTLQKKGHYVAMTGDGVNDAPSLKKADIGIAMGITGTDVSKEAADLILLDDNFSTIIHAIKEGRRIYDNILRFIKYLMTTNSGELWTLLLGPVLGLPVALLPIHILWINLVTDGLPAISLSFERAERNSMQRPPRPPQEGVFANGRAIHVLWVGLLMAGIALTLQEWAINNGLHWQTIVFNFICMSQMGHAMAIRSDNESVFTIGLFSNKWMLTSILAVFILQFVITYVPVLNAVFHTVPLGFPEFVITGIASSLIFLAVELEKKIRRGRKTIAAV